MISEDTFRYALENTRVVLPPRRRLETFGSSLLNYYLVTGDMDRPDLSRVREGRIEAERPQIMSPHHFSKLFLEGFGERAESFAAFLSQNAARFTFLQHGFHFRKNELQTHEVSRPVEAVLEEVRLRVEGKDDPLAAVIAGVDDAWEVCLLKFMVDLVQQSAPWQVEEMRRKGLLGDKE
ncbi:MAG: hypothetical protein PW734_05905 [Verrucomicrobium sp.]|nr:hypothetical protein [Verrucomicrobium sp.]